jgi:ABC-2 type transport system permease protein
MIKTGDLKTKYSYSLILLRELVVTDFKLRYQSSVLGYVWSLLRPLALFAILYVVFAVFLKVGNRIPHYPIYLLTGIVLWNFFSEVTNGSVSAIVDKGGLLRKINFPKYVILLATSVSALINLAINAIVIVLFAIVFKVDASFSIVLLPFLILELFVFALAVGFLLSALFVRYRDINYIWEVFMQGLFYATPILYPLALVPHKLTYILLLNPVAQSIQDIRDVAITPSTETMATVYGSPYARLLPIAIVILTTVIAIRYFRSRSGYFAEEV